jgi:putative sterol carrier protein
MLGKANGMQYFMMGKLKLAGDLSLAMKLTNFFKM